MLNLYIAKVLDDAFEFFDNLNLNVKTRIKKNKNKHKQLQMITGELLLNYALKDIKYEKAIKTDYTPKLILVDSELFISKSHSYDYVFVAISKTNVGCDIEKYTLVKNPGKVLHLDELKIYNEVEAEKKAAIFTSFWTAKEAFIKYYGSLIRPYKEINLKIEKRIDNFQVGKIDDLYCYQSSIKDYSFSVVSEAFIAPYVTFVGSESLKGEFI